MILCLHCEKPKSYVKWKIVAAEAAPHASSFSRESRPQASAAHDHQNIDLLHLPQPLSDIPPCPDPSAKTSIDRSSSGLKRFEFMVSSLSAPTPTCVSQQSW